IHLKENQYLCAHSLIGKGEIRLLDIENATSTSYLSHSNMLASLNMEYGRIDIHDLLINHEGDLCVIVSNGEMTYFQIWKNFSDPLMSDKTRWGVKSQTIDMLPDHIAARRMIESSYSATLSQLPDNSYVVMHQAQLIAGNIDKHVWLQKLDANGEVNGERLFQSKNMVHTAQLPNTSIFIRAILDEKEKLRIELIDLQRNSSASQTFSANNFILTENNSLMILSRDGQQFYQINYPPEKVLLPELNSAFEGIFRKKTNPMPKPLMEIMGQYIYGGDLFTEISVEQALDIEPRADQPKFAIASEPEVPTIVCLTRSQSPSP
ncbi:MAG: hypothetical protein ACYCQI_11725, partial [Gammaproteobacteria bacterium]